MRTITDANGVRWILELASSRGGAANVGEGKLGADDSLLVYECWREGETPSAQPKLLAIPKVLDLDDAEIAKRIAPITP
jgi:hypothetical protein